MKAQLARLLADPRTERFVLIVIVINAITLGLETDADLVARLGGALHLLDRVALSIFCAELAAKLYVHRGSFFRDPWNVFDFTIIAIALMPASGALSVLRALRVLRVLRLITVVPSLKRVVGALLNALPGMGSVVLLLSLLCYVGAVMATGLFGEQFPKLFGSIAKSAYTLFQVMTLEGWSDGIVRPVMEVSPHAWMFFIPFILMTTFVVLNLVVGVVVSAMQDEVEADRRKMDEVSNLAIITEVRALRDEVSRLSVKLSESDNKGA